MKDNRKIRIEIRYDPIKDKDMIDFIDNNGSTRAGFIKQVLKIFKNQMENTIQPTTNLTNVEQEDKNSNKKESNKKRRKANLGVSFSSKDFD